jgi:molybdopterin synthase sulfur carrier subunit
MKIRIKAFADVKDRLGFDEKELTVSEGISVAEVITMLEKCYPAVASMKNTFLYACNEEYCTGETVLGEGDTLAIFPHVSGG